MLLHFPFRNLLWYHFAYSFNFHLFFLPCSLMASNNAETMLMGHVWTKELKTTPLQVVLYITDAIQCPRCTTYDSYYSTFPFTFVSNLIYLVSVDKCIARVTFSGSFSEFFLNLFGKKALRSLFIQTVLFDFVTKWVCASLCLYLKLQWGLLLLVAWKNSNKTSFTDCFCVFFNLLFLKIVRFHTENLISLVLLWHVKLLFEHEMVAKMISRVKKTSK